MALPEEFPVRLITVDDVDDFEELFTRVMEHGQLVVVESRRTGERLFLVPMRPESGG